MSSVNTPSILSLPLNQLLKTMTIQELLDLSFQRSEVREFLKSLEIDSGGYKIFLNPNGILIEIPKQSYTFQWSDPNKSTLMDVLTKVYSHLESIFPGGINRLEVCPITYSQQLNRIPLSCEVLSIGKSEEFNGNDMEIDEIEDYPKEFLDSLLDRIHFNSGLLLNGPRELKTDNLKLFNVDYLKIDNSGWMTSFYLEKLQNRIINLQGSTLSESEINQYLKNLKNGRGNNRLKLLSIERENEWNMDKILERLESIQKIEKEVFQMDPELLLSSQEFLPFSIWQSINLFNSFNFMTIDEVRISIVKVQKSIRIFVWEKDPESRKRGNDEESNGPSAKRQRC